MACEISRICLDGVSNLRELGGYKTEDGHCVRKGCLYRSDCPDDIPATEENVNFLKNKLGIAYMVDFREVTKESTAPYNFSGIEYIRIPILPKAMAEKIQEAPLLTVNLINELLTTLYAEFVTHYKEQFRDFLRLLIDQAKGKGVLFHCAAGKDRTGFAAALLLSLLGVPYATVKKDFLFSNTCYSPTSAPLFLEGKEAKGALETLYKVDEKYIDNSFKAMTDEYGSVRKYVEKEMGISKEDIIALQKYYLE